MRQAKLNVEGCLVGTLVVMSSVQPCYRVESRETAFQLSNRAQMRQLAIASDERPFESYLNPLEGFRPAMGRLCTARNTRLV